MEESYMYTLGILAGIAFLLMPEVRKIFKNILGGLGTSVTKVKTNGGGKTTLKVFAWILGLGLLSGATWYALNQSGSSQVYLFLAIGFVLTVAFLFATGGKEAAHNVISFALFAGVAYVLIIVHVLPIIHATDHFFGDNVQPCGLYSPDKLNTCLLQEGRHVWIDADRRVTANQYTFCHDFASEDPNALQWRREPGSNIIGYWSTDGNITLWYKMFPGTTNCPRLIQGT